MTNQQQNLPEEISAINQCGLVTWFEDNSLSAEFRQQFNPTRIPVLGIRHI